MPLMNDDCVNSGEASIDFKSPAADSASPETNTSFLFTSRLSR